MLKIKNYKSRKNSLYICDRCKQELNIIENKIYSIYVKTPYANMRKKWDLCELDYKRLCRGIANGIKNNKN